MEIIALNHLIQLNGENFIDPRSKSSTLESTLKKVIDLYKVALSLESSPVHHAVSQGCMHILESWIKPKYGSDLGKIEQILIRPLIKIIESGEDKVAQVGAAHWIYFLIKASFESGNKELYDKLYANYLEIFKVNFCNFDEIDIPYWKQWIHRLHVLFNSKC